MLLMNVILMQFPRLEKISCKQVQRISKIDQLSYIRTIFSTLRFYHNTTFKCFYFLGIKISLNDLVIKAVATTLQYVPEVNLNVVSHPEGDDFQIMPSIDISVAVATEEGLITPIVKNVPSLSLPDISSTVKDLALRARNGQLKLDEFQVIEIKFERRICQYKKRLKNLSYFHLSILSFYP